MLWIRIGFNAVSDANTDPAFLSMRIRIRIQVTGEVFIPQKRTSSTSKVEFSSLLWVILALLDPDPYPNPDPAIQNECGSGSTTLVRTVHPREDDSLVQV